MSNQTGRIRFLLRLLVCLLLGPVAASPVAASPAAIAAPRFSDLIVFGDSLSDNGNVGRFSNGPVWVEWMAAALGLELHPARTGGTNYANAGARTHGGSMDVLAQTAAFLSHRGRADPDAFYVVFAGANDLLASPCQARNTSVVRQAAEAIGTAVGRLAEAGAWRQGLGAAGSDLSVGRLVGGRLASAAGSRKDKRNSPKSHNPSQAHRYPGYL